MNKRVKRKIKRIIVELIVTILLAAVGYVYDTYIAENSLIREYILGEQIEYKEQNVIKNLDNLKITFVDVGQADCILVSQNNEHTLIDAGNNEDGKLLVEYFKNQGITEFKYVFGTHAHEDHIGGMDDIIRNFKIGHFYMPDSPTTTKTYEDILDSLLEKRKPYEIPKVDKTYRMQDIDFKILYVGENAEDLNDSSIVIKMTYLNTSYLFTGDATSKVEKLILDKDLKSDVLKVGHHGSQYSSTEEFLNVVRPQYSIISVGKGNVYDHPKDITIKKLKKINSKIYRTDQKGSIILTSDGNAISIDFEKTNTNG